MHWIKWISKEKWIFAHDQGGHRYDHMTTNLLEVVNKIFKGTQNMLITALVKFMHNNLVKYFICRGVQAKVEYNFDWHHCKRLLDAFGKNHPKACTYKVGYDIM